MKTNLKKKLSMEKLGSSSLLLTCNFSLKNEEKDEINKIREAAKLNNETLHKDVATFGSSTFKYVGEEFYEGDVFVGTNEKLGKTLFKFKGQTGASVLFQLIKDKLVEKALLNSGVSQISYAFQVDPIESEDLESWIGKVQNFCRQKKKFRGSVFLDDNTLKIGQTNTSRSLSIEPILKKNSSLVTKFVISGQVQGKPATELWDMFLSSSSTQSNYFALNVYQVFELFDKTVFVEFWQSLLSKNFDLSNCKQLKRQTSQKLPAYRSVRAACTTLCNKVLDKGMSLGAQEIILEHLKEIVKEQKTIENFDSFALEIKNVLEGKSLPTKTK